MTIKTASVSEQIFTCYGTLLMKKPAKAVVLLATLTLTGFGIWGNILMEQEFDPSWFLTPDSYLYNWTAMNRKYFPNVGDRVTVWFSGVDFVHELEEEALRVINVREGIAHCLLHDKQHNNMPVSVTT